MRVPSGARSRRAVGVAVLLARGCAVVYGASDFLGGLASRRTSVFGVVAFSQLAGLVALVALLPWLGGRGGLARPGWGAGGGGGGGRGGGRRGRRRPGRLLPHPGPRGHERDRAGHRGHRGRGPCPRRAGRG